MMSATDLTEYERLRLENIQRNAAFLESLGIDSLRNERQAINDAAAAIKSKKKSKAISERQDNNPKKQRTSDETQRGSGLTSIAGRTRSSPRLQQLEQQVGKQGDVSDDGSDQNETDSDDLDKMPQTSDELDDHEFQVYAAIRAWRLKLCRELDIEPYKICQNRTIAELIRRRRNDANWADSNTKSSESLANDLLECWGLGAVKVHDDGFGVQMIRFIDGDQDVLDHLTKSRDLHALKLMSKSPSLLENQSPSSVAVTAGLQ